MIVKGTGFDYVPVMSHLWVSVWLLRFVLSQNGLYGLVLLNTRAILLIDVRRIRLWSKSGVNGELCCKGWLFLYDKYDLRSGVNTDVCL